MHEEDDAEEIRTDIDRGQAEPIDAVNELADEAGGEFSHGTAVVVLQDAAQASLSLYLTVWSSRERCDGGYSENLVEPAHGFGLAVVDDIPSLRTGPKKRGHLDAAGRSRRPPVRYPAHPLSR